MPTFILSLAAEIDIAGISEYIAKRNVAAAIKMLDRIEEACQMLAENPEVGEVVWHSRLSFIYGQSLCCVLSTKQY